MDWKKAIQILVIIGVLFDMLSTLWFSSLIGIESELNAIVKFLIQTKHWKGLIFYAIIYLTFNIHWIGYILKVYKTTKNTTLKAFSLSAVIIITILPFYAGSTWIFAYLMY